MLQVGLSIGLNKNFIGLLLYIMVLKIPREIKSNVQISPHISLHIAPEESDLCKLHRCSPESPTAF